MKIHTIGIMSPGSVGQAFAQQFRLQGFDVYTASGGRSARTRGLAAAAGITDVGSLARLTECCDVILSMLLQMLVVARRLGIEEKHLQRSSKLPHSRYPPYCVRKGRVELFDTAITCAVLSARREETLMRIVTMTAATLLVLSLVAAIASNNALAQAPSTGSGQAYPAKPIRLIVPLAPGGPSDILARTMAQKMTESLKQTVVVDNRTGAGGVIGTDIAAKSPPDGYTILLVAAATYTINANIYSKLPYDPRKDLFPVSILAAAPYVLCVHPALPAKTFKELLALAKARSGQLNYGSGGTGTGPQMAFELLKLRTGMDIVHIPYKGTGPAMSEQIAGQVQVGLFNLIAGMQVVQSGRLRGLAVSGIKRATRLPDVPTFAELGVTGLEDVGGHAMWLPTGVNKDIVTRLHQEMVRAVQSPEVKSRLEAEGAEIIANTPEQALASIRVDLEKWAEVVRKTGIKAN